MIREVSIPTRTGKGLAFQFMKMISAFLPAALESCCYDLDGNLLADGRRQYFRDAENRLTSMPALSDLPTTGKKKLEFADDAHGRRSQKKVYASNTGVAGYQLRSLTIFGFVLKPAFETDF
jgi:hypothetical protein